MPAVSFKKTSSSVGNCVTVPSESFVNSSEDFTLYLIYNPKSLDDGIIIEKNNASATTFPFSLELLLGSYKFSVKNSTETISVTSPKQAIIKTPNLIRLSRIKGSQIEIVIDGVSTTQADTLTSSTLNNAELAIGCRNGATPANFVSGDFGETAFYNRNINVKEKAEIEEYLYKKWKMKKFEGALPANCSVTGGVGYTTKTLLPIGSSTFSCDVEGYAGTINYNCPSSGGTATISGSCTANTCSVTGTGYSAKTLLPVGSASFPCDTGYTGTISYNCPSSGGTATITSGSCTASPIKCYARDKVGLRGTNYFDWVTYSTSNLNKNMYIVFSPSSSIGGPKLELDNLLGQEILPYVNRLKLNNNVYHGSLTFLSQSFYTAVYETITPSASITSYPFIPILYRNWE